MDCIGLQTVCALCAKNSAPIVTAILHTSLAKLPPFFYWAQATCTFTAGIATELHALHKSITSSWHEEMLYSTTCCSQLIKVVKFGLNQAQIWRYRKILAIKCWSLGAIQHWNPLSSREIATGSTFTRSRQH